MSGQESSSDWKSWFFNLLRQSPEVLMRIYRAYVAYSTPLDQPVKIPALLPSTGSQVEETVQQVVVASTSSEPNILDSVVSENEEPIEGDSVENKMESSAEQGSVQESSLRNNVLEYVFNHPEVSCRNVKQNLSHGDKELAGHISEELLRLIKENLIFSSTGDRRGRMSIHQSYMKRCQEMFAPQPTEAVDDDEED